MQTFLPFPSFKESAQSLDRQRLGKQRVEVKQILRALQGLSKGWQNHPAVRMWRGYETALAAYGVEICTEWRQRGYKDSLLPEFLAAINAEIKMPPWIGNESFHASHRSNLKRKNPEYYKHFNEPPNLPYVWPT